MHTFCLSELGPFPVDNCSMTVFCLALLFKWFTNSVSAVLSRFCHAWQPICVLTMVFITFSSTQRTGLLLFGSKSVDCCLLTMLELLLAEWPLHNISFGLAAVPPHSNIPSALQPHLLTAILYLALWPRLMAMVHQSIFHLNLSSFNPRLAGQLFLSA
jgi:hypothetical protein